MDLLFITQTPACREVPIYFLLYWSDVQLSGCGERLDFDPYPTEMVRLFLDAVRAVDNSARALFRAPREVSQRGLARVPVQCRMADSDTSRISPTAHYTGFIWHRNGMSHPALVTAQGWLMFHALRPATAVYEMTGGPSLDRSLLARHWVIDELLGREIESGRIGQVVEVAAGLSPRGYQFASRYADADLRYVEGDLAGMAERKRRILESAGLLGANHRVVELDALVDTGPRSIAAATEGLLDPERGTAVITEGLLGYLDTGTVESVWQRFARFLARFPRGMYLTDLHTESDARGLVGAKLFQKLLTAVARGQVYLHFEGAYEAERALESAGFAGADVRRAESFVRDLGLERVEGLDEMHRARVIQIAAARSGG
jgi:O-methyltransferase involved in polyketide biosynthesis